MPKATGLSAETRAAMLADELGDGDHDDDVEVEVPPAPPPVVVPPSAPPPSAPALAAPIDAMALIAALVAGIGEANAGTAHAIKDALGNAAALARDPVPENKVTAGHSVYSHPDGDRAHPRTTLKCPMYLGVYDGDGKVDPAFEIFADTCTEWERVELNKLTPGTYPAIERNDGLTAPWKVVTRTDDNGVVNRLVIAVPVGWLGRDQFQAMPSQKSFLRQLNAGTPA